MERAENMARILHINETYARDNPEGPDWAYILDIYADRQRFDEKHNSGNAANVLNFYILDKSNPTSIAFALENARENARTVRHLISTEMWSQINAFHTKTKALTQRDLRLSNLAQVAGDIVLNCQAFEGITEGTLLRGEAWCHYQLGKNLERADQTTRILDIGYQRLSLSNEDTLSSVQWHALLRSVSGYHAFRSRHPVGCGPADIAQFFLYDEEFPRAAMLCIKRATERLIDIKKIHGAEHNNGVEHARRALEFALETGPGEDLSAGELHAFLDKTQMGITELSNAIAMAYFR